MIESLNAIGDILKTYSPNVYLNVGVHSENERIVYSYTDVSSDFDEAQGILTVDVFYKSADFLTKVEAMRADFHNKSIVTTNESIQLHLNTSNFFLEDDRDFYRHVLTFEVKQYGG